MTIKYKDDPRDTLALWERPLGRDQKLATPATPIRGEDAAPTPLEKVWWERPPGRDQKLATPATPIRDEDAAPTPLDADRKSGITNDPAIDKRRPADEDGLSDYDANYPDGAVPSSGSARRRKRRGSLPEGHPQDEHQAGGDTPSSSPAGQE